MADIFGREISDYSHLRVVEHERAGMAETWLRHRAQTRSLEPHNFDVLGSQFQRAESNAQAIAYMTNSLMAVQSVIDEVIYSSYRLNKMVPIKRSGIPEGAQTYAVRIMDQAGRGRFITYAGTDAPAATVNVRLENHPLFYGGASAEWTMEDLRQCMFGGVALDTELVQAATTGCMEHIEQVCLEGDDMISAKGLVNQPQAASDAQKVKAVAASGVMSGMTADGLVTFIQGQVSSFIVDTVEVFGRKITAPLHIFLPVEQAGLLVNTRIGDGLRTVWDFLASRNDWSNYTGRPLVLNRLTECKGAGWQNANGSGTRNDRMILMVNDQRVLEFAEVIAPRVVGTSDASVYSVRVGLEYKIGQLVVKRPIGMKYVDGV